MQSSSSKESKVTSKKAKREEKKDVERKWKLA